jgi:cytochrome P450
LKKTQYSLDLESVASVGALRSVFPFLTNLGQYIPIPAIKKAKAATSRISQYAIEALQRYRRLVDEDPANVKPTLFTNLFRAIDDDSLTFEEIRDNAQGYIIAGSDTTATTLVYLLWTVSNRPELRDALVAELSTLPNDFDDGALRSLPLLSGVINESLRLYSAVPAPLPRIVPAGGFELAGRWLPAGVTVSSQAYSMHRDPTVWGPTVNDFDPSRWEHLTKNMKDSFMPFGGGSRGEFDYYW